MRFFCRFLIAVAGSIPAFAQAVPGDFPERIDRVFAEFDKPGSPGCAVALSDKGKLIYARGYGFANLDTGVRIDSHTIFPLGATSMQFVAMAVLLLEQDGKLSLDDDIRKLVPEIREYQKPITILQLLTHTSGLREYLTLFRLALRPDGSHYDDDAVLQMLARQKETDFAPGDRAQYSTSNYFLLGLVVKRAAGIPLHQFTNERIFLPLGMNHTHFGDLREGVQPDHTITYDAVSGDEGKFRIDMIAMDSAGEGGVHTSVEDLVKWAENLRSGRVGPKNAFWRIRTGTTLDSRPQDRSGVNWISGREAQEAGNYSGAEHRLKLSRNRTGVAYGHFKGTAATICNLSSSRQFDLAERTLDSVGFNGTGPRGVIGGIVGGVPGAPPPPPAKPEDFSGDYYSEELDETYRLRAVNDQLVLLQPGGAPHLLVGRIESDLLSSTGAMKFERRDRKITGFLLSSEGVRNLRFVRREESLR